MNNRISIPPGGIQDEPFSDVTVADPEWVEHTPGEEFRLIMYDSMGVSLVEIVMTRDEYIALKTHLAELRGYFRTPPDELPVAA